MAAIVNDRDVLLQAASTRVYSVNIPPNVTVPSAQILNIFVACDAAYWRVDSEGDPVNTSAVLTALLPPSFAGHYVTWSKVGTNSIPPTAGTTNTWTIYAADQVDDIAKYTATIVVDGKTYTDTFTLARIRDGITGERGATGAAGTLTGYGKLYGIVSNSWDDGVASRVIYNMLTGETATSGVSATSHLLLGDTVTLSNNSSYSETKFWTGFAWEPVGMVVDGNLLVNGTVAANKLTAGSILTGQSANATISIGDINFIGSLKSPFHVTKTAAASAQVLMSALNTKDDSVAIWGATAGQNGNAVSGTASLLESDVSGTLRYALIGILGSDTFDAGVYGSAYGTGYGAVFDYWSAGAAGSADPAKVLQNYLRCASSSHALQAKGRVELVGTTSPLSTNGSDGTLGQVLTSQGAGATPIWSNASGGAPTAAQVQTALAGTSSATSVSSTIRSTALTLPTSGAGVEVAYDAPNSTGYIICYDRTASAYKGLNINASSMNFAATGAVQFTGATSYSFNVTPTVGTMATSDSSTKAASTAYVISRISNDAPTKTGSGASGSWGINITGSSASCTGNAASATTASSCSGNAATASSAATVNNKKIVGGLSGAASSINTGLSSVEGFSATTIDPYYVCISSISGGTVNLIFRDAAGNNVGAQAVRWMASGT